MGRRQLFLYCWGCHPHYYSVNGYFVLRRFASYSLQLCYGVLEGAS